MKTLVASLIAVLLASNLALTNDTNQQSVNPNTIWSQQDDNARLEAEIAAQEAQLQRQIKAQRETNELLEEIKNNQEHQLYLERKEHYDRIFK